MWPTPTSIPASAVTDPAAQPYLSVRNLAVRFQTEAGTVHAVDGVSFDVRRGGTLGIVGESGSGKSVTCRAVLGLYQRQRGVEVTGAISLGGQPLLELDNEPLRLLRGSAMAFVPQDPLSALHPYYRIGEQIAEAYRAHNHVSRSAARTRAIEMLDLVGIPEPRRRAGDYPHQFSGGMRQRVMIAMALVCNPTLLIADEPTTALDVTVQAQILDLLRALRCEFGSAIVLITHDLGVVAELCEEVVVMYGGQCVERGSVDDIFYGAEMPYTWGLQRSAPRLDRPRTSQLRAIDGQPPSMVGPAVGCVFAPRCTYTHFVSDNRCNLAVPPLTDSAGGHEVRCHIRSGRRRQIWTDEIAPTL
jgi:peptide/nickel transport system ATP-binding protein